MDLNESTVQSFIIKLWLEGEAAADKRTWRGYITHVPSGSRRYLKQLAEIADFIAEYLEPDRAPVHLRSRIRNWLRDHRPISNKEE